MLVTSPRARNVEQGVITCVLAVEKFLGDLDPFTGASSYVVVSPMKIVGKILGIVVLSGIITSREGSQ